MNTPRKFPAAWGLLWIALSGLSCALILALAPEWIGGEFWRLVADGRRGLVFEVLQPQQVDFAPWIEVPGILNLFWTSLFTLLEDSAALLVAVTYGLGFLWAGCLYGFLSRFMKGPPWGPGLATVFASSLLCGLLVWMQKSHLVWMTGWLLPWGLSLKRDSNSAFIWLFFIASAVIAPFIAVISLMLSALYRPQRALLWISLLAVACCSFYWQSGWLPKLEHAPSLWLLLGAYLALVVAAALAAGEAALLSYLLGAWGGVLLFSAAAESYGLSYVMLTTLCAALFYLIHIWNQVDAKRPVRWTSALSLVLASGAVFLSQGRHQGAQSIDAGQVFEGTSSALPGPVIWIEDFAVDIGDGGHRAPTPLVDLWRAHSPLLARQAQLNIPSDAISFADLLDGHFGADVSDLLLCDERWLLMVRGDQRWRLISEFDQCALFQSNETSPSNMAFDKALLLRGLMAALALLLLVLARWELWPRAWDLWILLGAVSLILVYASAEQWRYASVPHGRAHSLPVAELGRFSAWVHPWIVWDTGTLKEKIKKAQTLSAPGEHSFGALYFDCPDALPECRVPIKVNAQRDQIKKGISHVFSVKSGELFVVPFQGEQGGSRWQIFNLLIEAAPEITLRSLHWNGGIKTMPINRLGTPLAQPDGYVDLVIDLDPDQGQQPCLDLLYWAGLADFAPDQAATSKALRQLETLTVTQALTSRYRWIGPMAMEPGQVVTLRDSTSLAKPYKIKGAMRHGLLLYGLRESRFCN